MRGRGWTLGIILFLGLLPLAAPLAAGPAGLPTKGGILRAALYSEPTGLNFQTLTGIPAYQVARNIFDPLAKWDGNTQTFKPWLATQWRQQSETSWVFTLRRGVQFHKNYGEVTADDVAFSFNNIIQNKLTQSWAMTFIKNVEAVDKYTVRFNLERAHAPFMVVSIVGPIGVLSKKAFDEMGADRFARTPVGAGPFELDQWVAGDRIALKRFDRYWQKGLPHVQGIVFRIVPDPFVRQSMVRTGELDFTDVPDYRDLDTMKREAGLRIERVPGWGWDYLSFNTTRAPTNNKLVRQALSYAIDRQAIANAIYFGYAQVADVPIPPTFPAGKQGLWKYPRTADIATARRLLSEAGFGSGVTISVITYDAEHLRRELQIIAEQARQAGIRLELTFADRPTYNRAVNNIGGNMPYNAEFGYISLIGPDEDTALYWFQHTETLRWHGWQDAEKDQLLNQARVTQNRPERTRMYQRVVDKILDDVPYLYTVHPEVVRAMRDRVQGFTIDPKEWDVSFHQAWLKPGR